MVKNISIIKISALIYMVINFLKFTDLYCPLMPVELMKPFIFNNKIMIINSENHFKSNLILENVL